MPDEINILSQQKPKTIKLADGKEYKISPLNLTVMADIEEEFGCNFIEVIKQFLSETTRSFTSIRKLLYVLLKQNYPDLAITDVGNLVERDELPKVYEAIINIWGSK